MSLKTWEKKFYPVPASAATGDALTALKHSELKWRGLNPSNLKKHRCERAGSAIKEVKLSYSKQVPFLVNGMSCALCRAFLVDGVTKKETCLKCPLRIIRGKRCDSMLPGESLSPYHEFTYRGNNQPMLKLIRRAIKLHESEQGKSQDNS